jgi:hypothetical protein
MNNDDGFVITRGEPPPESLFAAAQAEIASGRCGEKCHELMKFGLKVRTVLLFVIFGYKY